MKKATNERPVIVTTEFRGVFFGYATNTDGETIELKRSRLCISWSSDLRGFMGLTFPPFRLKRLWLVALHGEIQQQEDKFGALEREIIGEVLS